MELTSTFAVAIDDREDQHRLMPYVPPDTDTDDVRVDIDICHPTWLARQDICLHVLKEKAILHAITRARAHARRMRASLEERDDDTVCFEIAVTGEPKHRLPLVKSPPARNIFHRWIEFPPECVNIGNYVTRARLSEPIDIRIFANKYPFCEIKTNWRSISLSSRYPFRKASIHPSGLINFSGDSNFRIARAVADRYLKMIQECGYPNIKINNFRVVNLTCMMDFPFSIDVHKWHKSNKDSIKFKGGFVGVRQQKLASTLASGASITVFKDKVNVVGTWNEHVVCYDIMRQYEKYKEFQLSPPSPTQVPADTKTPDDDDKKDLDVASQSQPKRRRVVRTTNRNYKKLKIT